MKSILTQRGEKGWFLPQDPIQRFWSKVKLPVGIGECWEWIGTKIPHGYGMFYLKDEKILAHRFAYEQVFEKIPDGKHIDHLCRNRACVNPYHMEPVSNRENVLRGISPCAEHAKQTRCKRGHLLEGDNLDQTKLAKGERICMTCKREYRKWYYQTKQKPLRDQHSEAEIAEKLGLI